ncbi:MAG: Ig-like domain-containing protein [Methylococcales bacterium]|nr:Ig-like domain-containing protein [Methylococcales bacterium]
MNTNIKLRRSIQMVLAGSMCLTGVANAVLLDHGPADPLLTWPSWYRDNNGLALGLCQSASTMCLPTVADVTGFAGNVGPEMFYNAVQFKGLNTGSDFQYNYLAGLEASYLPVGKPVHGTEFVFARVRISFNFTDSKKNGTYKVIHPFGVEVFENVQATATTNVAGAKAATFYTVDVPLGPVMNFKGALTGPIGPFITWDNMPANGFTGPIAGEKFVGDPTLLHTFTGSPFNTNFLRIEGPVGSNLDGLGHNFIEVSQGNVVGQLWTAPIAQDLSIDQATVSSSGTTHTVDVWATSSTNQKLFLTGTNVPSLELHPSGAVAGKYHGHVEYPSNISLPNSITITNVTSNPVVSKTIGLTDVVSISKASYDSNTGIIVLKAKSNDEITQPTLKVEGIPGLSATNSLMSQTACTAMGITPIANEVCFNYTLPLQYEVPDKVSVISTKSGNHAEQFVEILGNPQQALNRPKASSFTGISGFTVNTNGVTPLLNAGVSLPIGAYIIQQPDSGTVNLNATNQWIFTANAGTTAGIDSLEYVIQDANLGVSDIAIAELNKTFSPSPAIAKADQFAVSSLTATTTKLAVLKNDTTASANSADSISNGSVFIVTKPTKGNAVANADGTVSYTPIKKNTSIADSFTYNVKTSSGKVSNTATVQVQQFSSAESVAITPKYTIASHRWVITGTTNWFGATLAQTQVTCWIGSATAPTSSTLIGSTIVTATGAFTVDTLGGSSPVVNGVNNTAMKCATTNGGIAAGITNIK